MNVFQHDINDGLITAFIDSTHPSNLAFTPQFLSNDYRSGKKVLASIEDELKNCDSFRISVAFITMGGITPLLMTLKELENRGIKGELLTTNYQRFTSPDALRKLHSLSNLTIRMFDTEAAGKGRLKPNSMQVSFITNLKKMIDAGEERALLISATGTGKTYASAFAMRELGFRRVLFVTHRTQLSQQTMKSYRNVFGENISMGFLGNGETDYSSDIIFANVQTISRDQHLNQFDRNAFDCVILDEAKDTGLIQRYA